MIREVIFNDEARNQLLIGVTTLADAVRVTLGPKGRNVVIDKNFVTPHITKDGVTVAQEIVLEDRVQNIGCSMVKSIAKKTAEEAGDGTTTATVLAHALFKEGLDAMGDNNPIDLKRGMDKACQSVVDYIRSQAKPVKNLLEVATISTNGDKELGALIAEIMDKVGQSGTVTVENSNSHKTFYEIVEGHKYDSGYVSPYFITDTVKQSAELEDTMVLVTDEKITDYAVIRPWVDLCHSNNKPLLIVCEEMGGQALHMLLANRAQKGLKICVTFAPGFGGQRKALLEDIALTTGAIGLGNSYGRPFHMFSRSDREVASVLGGAHKIVVDRSGTVIIGGNASKEAIQDRIKEIESHRELETDNQVKTKFSDRIARLSGGVAILKVGGYSEVEVIEKKYRIDDAIRAVQSSMEEGIVEGGGYTYLKAVDYALRPEYENYDESAGGDILFDAIQSPFRQIAYNAGKDPDEIIRDGGLDQGYDFRTDKYCNLIKSGIVDPAKVTRTALENAVSIAGLLLTTECVVHNKLTDLDIAMLAKGPQANRHQ